LLERDGVDTGPLARRDDVQTSASVLPIRPSGERPAFHVVGANGSFGPGDLPEDEIEAATHLNLGGTEVMGGEAAEPPPGSAARPPRWSRRGSAPTTATTTSPRSRSWPMAAAARPAGAI
jgi:hypothetical protein